MEGTGAHPVVSTVWVTGYSRGRGIVTLVGQRAGKGTHGEETKPPSLVRQEGDAYGRVCLTWSWPSGGVIPCL